MSHLTDVPRAISKEWEKDWTRFKWWQSCRPEPGQTLEIKRYAEMDKELRRNPMMKSEAKHFCRDKKSLYLYNPQGTVVVLREM